MSNSKYRLVLNEGSIDLDPDRSYNVYGEIMFAIDLVEQDFGHLTWFDEILVLRELKMNNEISMLFHPTVLTSLYDEQEASPYFGKDRFEAEAVFRRLKTTEKTDEETERKLMKPVEWTPTMISKKGKVVGRLVTLGFERLFSREMVAKFLEEKGEGYMNLTVNTIADHVDKFVRDITVETEGRYIDKESKSPCRLYLVKFTHKESGEQFIKPGITRREIEERFCRDKKIYDIDVIYEVVHPMHESVEREKHIQSRFKQYRFEPEVKLINNGNSEVLHKDVDTTAIIELMGTKKVK